MTSRHLVGCFLALILLTDATHSLTCYENDSKGSLWEVTRPNVTLCGYMTTDINQIGRVFAMDPAVEIVDMYSNAFQYGDSVWSPLASCVLDSMNFANHDRLVPDWGVEVSFRCACRTNLCNIPANLAGYLAAQNVLHTGLPSRTMNTP